jgi:hypothetical protein
MDCCVPSQPRNLSGVTSACVRHQTVAGALHFGKAQQKIESCPRLQSSRVVMLTARGSSPPEPLSRGVGFTVPVRWKEPRRSDRHLGFFVLDERVVLRECCDGCGENREIRPASMHRIASVTTLGSPFRGLVVHPLVLTLGNLVRHGIRKRYPKPPQECATSRCSCAFARSLRRKWPRSVAQTAIYTREDGMVDWHYCRAGDPEVDVEVCGTHLGLTFNSTTYLRIAERLASGTRKRAAKPLSHPAVTYVTEPRKTEE